MNLKILWVQDCDNNGPINGLAEYNGEKLWFNRDKSQSFVDSFGDQIGDISNNMDTYLLLRISSKDLDLATNNHLLYCEETGAPINHGDPITRKDLSVKNQLIKSFGTIRKYNHKIIPAKITGELIRVVKESDFSNYRVPKIIYMPQD